MDAMDKIDILAKLHTKADIVWDELRAKYSELAQVKTPDIILNNRFTRTAGVAWQGDDVIELASKFLLHSAQYRAIMYSVILPHELAHMADWYIYGESEAKCGHGKGWQEIMESLGLKAEKFHHMDLKA